MSRIRPTKFAHVVYRTRRFEQMLHWYETVRHRDTVMDTPVRTDSLFLELRYADPDGNQMEFQVDSYSSSEDANAFINAHFGANPLGVEYDPEDWLARLRAGAPVSDFLVRQVHEPVSPLRGSIAS